jgi:hypothetical protein
MTRSFYSVEEFILQGSYCLKLVRGLYIHVALRVCILLYVYVSLVCVLVCYRMCEGTV